MTPTTPSGRYSTVHAWLAITSPAGTLRRPRTFWAFFAAQAMWSMARLASSVASLCGLPVSWCTTSASWAMRRVITPAHAVRRSARSSNVSPAHHTAASWARATFASTSSAVWTGWVPTTSPVTGLSESKVSRVASRVAWGACTSEVIGRS